MEGGKFLEKKTKRKQSDEATDGDNLLRSVWPEVRKTFFCFGASAAPKFFTTDGNADGIVDVLVSWTVPKWLQSSSLMKEHVCIGHARFDSEEQRLGILFLRVALARR